MEMISERCEEAEEQNDSCQIDEDAIISQCQSSTDVEEEKPDDPAASVAANEPEKNDMDDANLVKSVTDLKVNEVKKCPDQNVTQSELNSETQVKSQQENLSQDKLQHASESLHLQLESEDLLQAEEEILENSQNNQGLKNQNSLISSRLAALAENYDTDELNQILEERPKLLGSELSSATVEYRS